MPTTKELFRTWEIGSEFGGYPLSRGPEHFPIIEREYIGPPRIIDSASGETIAYLVWDKNSNEMKVITNDTTA